MHTNNTHKQKIESLEKRAQKIIFNGKRDCKEIGSIDNLLRKKLCEQVFKCIHGDTCVNLKNYFEIMSNNTRNENILLRVPRIKLESTKKSFYFTGTKFFNDLPASTRGAESISKFLAYFN